MAAAVRESRQGRSLVADPQRSRALGLQVSQAGAIPLEHGLAVVRENQQAFRLGALLPQISALSRSLPERQRVRAAMRTLDELEAHLRRQHAEQGGEDGRE